METDMQLLIGVTRKSKKCKVSRKVEVKKSLKPSNAAQFLNVTGLFLNKVMWFLSLNLIKVMCWMRQGRCVSPSYTKGKA